MRTSTLLVGLVALALTGLPLHGLLAQQRVDATITGGASLVRYDGFLPSSAASLTPSVRVASGNASLEASVASLFFQSGNSSVTGALDGAWMLRRVPHVGRVVLLLSGGASEYASDYRFANALAGARLVATPATGPLSFWLESRAGTTWARTPIEIPDALGARVDRAGGLEASGGTDLRLRDATLHGGLRAQRVGDERLTDASLSGDWRRGRLLLDAQLGARRARVDATRGFADAGVTYALGSLLSVSTRVGRYPGDPVRGTLGGRFAELSAKLLFGTVGRHEPAAGSTPELPFTRFGFEVRRASNGGRELRMRVPGANRVEIMADFTDWEPVALASVGDEQWSLTTLVPPGVHRVNVRIDGGAWTVPPGLTAVADEFGGAVGLLVVE